MSVDPGRQLVDTNVLVYAHDRSAGAKGTAARQLIGDLWSSGAGCLSVQILLEFYVVVTRTVRRILDPSAAADVVADLATWHVHAPTAVDAMATIVLQGRHKIALWDAMILRSADQLGCRVVWSEDLGDGQSYDGITVRNPFA